MYDKLIVLAAVVGVVCIGIAGYIVTRILANHYRHKHVHKDALFTEVKNFYLTLPKSVTDTIVSLPDLKSKQEALTTHLDPTLYKNTSTTIVNGTILAYLGGIADGDFRWMTDKQAGLPLQLLGYNANVSARDDM